MKLSKMKRALAKKGYDLSGKSPEFIENLFALYQPRKKQPLAKGWKIWESTNRLHQYG